MKIKFTLNGRPTQVDAPPSMSLLTLLREQLGLTGTKCGCDTGDCGVCSVLFDGELAYSCLLAVSGLEGHEVTTIEGIAGPDGSLSDLQESFLHNGAVQCGYCIPSMILAGEALLRRVPDPSRDEIRAAISHVLCRCTGYQQIIDSVQEAARRKRKDMESAL
ncbi:MAG TPA: (2Fe-2S)-binding protein [Anaerolineales bacterium]|nr:(2Fe-2S)-binding protein [Anaerolineales bacterium]